MRYPRLTAYVCDSPWAILPAKLEAMAAALDVFNAGARFDAEQVAARIGREQPPPEPTRQGSVAVLPLYGVLSQRADMFTQASGGTSTDRFAEQLSTLVADKGVSAIVLDIDSPGGSVYGVQELADQLYAARQAKPIIGVANSLAASAAYWLGSQASELYVTPGGEVGSIGVIAMHTDISGVDEKAGVKRTILTAGQFKAEGNPYEPLGDEAQNFIQTRLNDYYVAFLGSVARGRGIGAATVEGSYGQGRVYGAEEARRRGMVDGIATLGSIVARQVETAAGQVRREQLRRRAAIAGI